MIGVGRVGWQCPFFLISQSCLYSGKHDETEIVGRKNRLKKENLVERWGTGTVWGTDQADWEEALGKGSGLAGSAEI